MATVTQQFAPASFVLPATAYAQHDVLTGTNFPIHVLAFDAASDEAAHIVFRASNYGSGNLTVAIDWYADSASSGDVVWGAQIAAITPDTDSQDIETDALATASTVTDSHLTTVGQRLHRASITVSNLDSLAADDDVFLRLYRDADNGSDTMTGDALVVLVTVSYSDT